jgi:predicted Zn-dependent peptidase
MPERTIMPNGIPLNIIRAGNEEVVRMDILIGAGTWHQTYPLQALFTNRMLREGTRHMTSAEISEKLDFYGAWVELSTSMNCNFLTLYSLNKFFPQTLAILSAMMKEATYPEADMRVTVETNRQQFLVNSTKVDVMAR